MEVRYLVLTTHFIVIINCYSKTSNFDSYLDILNLFSFVLLLMRFSSFFLCLSLISYFSFVFFSLYFILSCYYWIQIVQHYFYFYLYTCIIIIERHFVGCCFVLVLTSLLNFSHIVEVYDSRNMCILRRLHFRCIQFARVKFMYAMYKVQMHRPCK